MIPVTEFAEDKQERDIARRRKLDEERKKRIFDAKVRTTGKDLEFLKMQMEEKKKREEEERQRELAFEAEQLEADRLLMELDAQYQREREEARKELLEFYKTNQQKTMRREFYLEDPDRFKKDHPAREGDDDPNLSVSGLQRMEGEDLGYAERQLRLKEQQREWASEQMREQQMRKELEQKKEQLEQKRQEAIAQRLAELDKMEQEERKAAIAKLREENRLAAEQKKEDERRRKEMEEEMERLQIERQLASSTLTEDMTVARSVANPNRLRPDHYKGMFAEDKERIKQQQRDQIEEHKARKEREEAEAKAEELRQQQIQQRLLAMEQQSERDRKEKERQILMENQQKAIQDRERKKKLDEQYSNTIDKSFYDYFQTTSR
ncbi:putative RIB43A domain with coiled-coils 1 L homeolog [Blattamonas nauphoetae]|uniref:RIB43A domain with coiled-coils 1 L homeolog n=1 Tax=Blattamonas nauphoetae TaxID=2049346 RepID=A0ABQ9YL64_9EUKA|nr:putative RIB43A domain with coiled-coils 1 L homeolog [Blattamonas nauphoetae]